MNNQNFEYAAAKMIAHNEVTSNNFSVTS